jgi:hypothetical protein
LVILRRPFSVIVTGSFSASFSKVVRFFEPGGRPPARVAGLALLEAGVARRLAVTRLTIPLRPGRHFVLSAPGFVLAKNPEVINIKIASIVLKSLFRCYSIAIRLLGPKKFVDRRKNSVDPPSNEFRIQPADLALYFLTQTGRTGGKNAIFAVLADLAQQRLSQGFAVRRFSAGTGCAELAQDRADGITTSCGFLSIYAN